MSQKEDVRRVWEDFRAERQVMLPLQPVIGKGVYFMTVIADDRLLAQAMRDRLIRGGILFRQMSSHHTLFVIKGQEVNVFTSLDVKKNGGMSAVAAGVLAQAKADVQREEKFIQHRRSVLRHITKNKSAVLQDVSNQFSENPCLLAMRSLAVGKVCHCDYRIVVSGEVMQGEAQDLIKELKQHRAGLLKEIGANLSIIFDDNRIYIHCDRVFKQAHEKALRRFIEGFYRLDVMSDFHLSLDDPTDLFGREKEIEVVRKLDRAIRDRSSVIINGDLFELWQQSKKKQKDIKKRYRRDIR